MNKIGDTLSINNLSNNFLQRPTFSDVIISTVHHLGNVRNYNSSVKRRSLFFHDFFSVQADKPRDGINLICYLLICWKLESYKTYQPLNAQCIETEEIGIISLKKIGNYVKSDMFFNIDVKARHEHIPTYKENFLSCHLFSADAIGLRSNFGILSITEPR